MIINAENLQIKNVEKHKDDNLDYMTMLDNDTRINK
jgi:hypothetical protein